MVIKDVAEAENSQNDVHGKYFIELTPACFDVLSRRLGVSLA